MQADHECPGQRRRVYRDLDLVGGFFRRRSVSGDQHASEWRRKLPPCWRRQAIARRLMRCAASTRRMPTPPRTPTPPPSVSGQVARGTGANKYVRSDTPSADGQQLKHNAQNTANQQTSSNFNISGDGTAGGVLSGNVLNAVTQYNIGGQRVLGVQFANQNTFLGAGTGAHQTNGTQNSFFGNSAGLNNSSGQLQLLLRQSGRRKQYDGLRQYFLRHVSPAGLTRQAPTMCSSATRQEDRTRRETSAPPSATERDFPTPPNTATPFLVPTRMAWRELKTPPPLARQAKVTQSNSLVLGSINGVNAASADTNVGIGTTRAGGQTSREWQWLLSTQCYGFR